jgi:hypothetical protein
MEVLVIGSLRATTSAQGAARSRYLSEPEASGDDICDVRGKIGF